MFLNQYSLHLKFIDENTDEKMSPFLPPVMVKPMILETFRLYPVTSEFLYILFSHCGDNCAILNLAKYVCENG